MKKITIISLFLTVFAFQTRSQNVVALGANSFGIYGGITFQNINGVNAGGDKLSNSLVPRFIIGINEEFPIAPDFFIQAGLQFISKGTEGNVNFTDNSGTNTLKRNLSLYYIESPVNLVYKPYLGTGHLILAFGPYVGYALAGNAKFTGNNSPADKDLEFVSDAPNSDVNNLVYYKRWDIGANFSFGYEFSNGISTLLTTQLGLVNINSNTSSKLAESNTGFGLLVGYRFL
ncbi:MAG: outer membrane beta-barrel protein [Candidatus Methylacidiphilales bacterium]